MKNALENAMARRLRHDDIPRAELLRLASFATGKSRECLVADSDALVAHDVIDRLDDLIARRAAGEPMAYLLGHREFYGRDFAVDPRVLIPRPETELLVELAIAWLAKREAVRVADEPLRVLDLGTGSGVIAITLALECHAIVAMATDVSGDALEIATHNAQKLGAAVSFAQSDWFTAFNTASERMPLFDLIVSNPPYIATNDPHLSEGDLRYEPRIALVGASDGLDAIRRIVEGSKAHLRSDGCLMLEHGYDQAGAVGALFVESGFVRAGSSRDLAGIERVAEGANCP